MLNLYQSILSDVLTRFEDKIIILDGWPIKEFELLVESSYPIAIPIPQSFTSQMIDGNFYYVWFNENFKTIASKCQHILTLAQFIKLIDFIMGANLDQVYLPMKEKLELLFKFESEGVKLIEEHLEYFGKHR